MITKTSFRERCAALVSKLSTDGILRQNDPVQTVAEFVQSERGRAADESLEATRSLIIYFGTAEDREEFLALWRTAKPGSVARKIIP